MSEKVLVQVDTITLLWQCPVCNYETETGVGEALESGTPFCSICLEASNGQREEEMEYTDSAEARIYEK